MQNKISRCEKMLARWRGKPARVHAPHETQVPCVDAIVFGDEPGKNLLVACIDPRSVAGPREWGNSHIILRPVTLDNGEEGVELLDEANEVRIVSGTFEVKENVKFRSGE